MLARAVVVFPRVGLGASYVCVVMWRLGERLSMTDGSTMQTSFQYAIADKKGFIASDRGGGGLSTHEACNRLRRTQAWLAGGSSHKPLVSHTLPVDVVSCTLTTLHKQITLSKKMRGHFTSLCVILVGGMCHSDGCRQENTRLHAISCTKTGWNSLTHNRVLHQELARSLCESKTQFVVEDT